MVIIKLQGALVVFIPRKSRTEVSIEGPPFMILLVTAARRKDLSGSYSERHGKTKASFEKHSRLMRQRAIELHASGCLG